MTMTHDPAAFEKAPAEAELELDHRLEVLLDELVASSEPPTELPSDLARQLLLNRPFAPWEVRQARAWKVPALTGAGLLFATLALGLGPLWSLGPTTAFAVWTQVVAVALESPLSVALDAGPLIAEALSKVGRTLPPGALWGVGAAALLASVPLVWALAARRRSPAPAGGAGRGLPA